MFNDTKVINARLLGRKTSGGRVEALIERVLEPTLALAMVRTSHTPGPGTHLIFDEEVHATVEGRQDDFFCFASTATCSLRSRNTASCRCRRISSMPLIQLMRFVIKPYTRRARARLRRRLPAFTSPPAC